MTSREKLELRHIADRLARAVFHRKEPTEGYVVPTDLVGRLIELIDRISANGQPEPAGMTLDRARAITADCVRSVMSKINGPEYVELPDGVSLEEMLEANRIVGGNRVTKRNNGGERHQLNVDPRGLAILYAFEHYGRDRDQIVEAMGFDTDEKLKKRLEEMNQEIRERFAFVD